MDKIKVTIRIEATRLKTGNVTALLSCPLILWTRVILIFKSANTQPLIEGAFDAN